MQLGYTRLHKPSSPDAGSKMSSISMRSEQRAERVASGVVLAKVLVVTNLYSQLNQL